MHNKLLRYIVGITVICAFSATMLQAQEEEEVIVLEEVDADSVPIEESILATTRPISSVYGTARSILDTPRNVNIISREQLDAISISSVRDFSKLTSSSYTKSNFGAPTTPNLRGQEADLMINGIRRGHSTNGNGVPINFNSVESVNIVKGPAGAVYGTSPYVGGYADLITKRAYFEEGGSFEYSLGSYDQHTLNIDTNTPISDTLAIRTSIQLKEWEGFWDRWYDKSQSVYAAIAWKPNSKYRLDLMAEYYKGNYTENWGINRVTQDLFDNGRYIVNNQSDAGYAVHNSNLGNRIGSEEPDAILPGPGVIDSTAAVMGVPFAATGLRTITPVDVNNTVPVNRSWKLSAPGDDSNADVFWAQAIQEYKPSDNLTIINNTYFHYKDRHTFSSYHYSELLKDNWSIENRLSFLTDLESDSFQKISLNYGARFKYQEIWFTNHYYNEPVNFYDLTRDPEFNRVPLQGYGANPYVAGVTPRGILDQWYVGWTFSEDSIESEDTETFSISPYFQSDFVVSDQLSFLFGYTVDIIDHKEGTPVEIVGPFGPLDHTKKSFNGTMHNFNISGSYKPSETSAVYLTYNEGKHVSVNTGGAIEGKSLDEDNVTELIELGANIVLFDGKGYLGAALFSQEYTERDVTGGISQVSTEGFEIELNYQPNRNLFATVGYSWLNSTRSAVSMASPYTIDRADETGDFYISPWFADIPEDQEFENAGCPKHLLNALVQYKFDNGFGVQANLVLWGKMNSGYGGYPVTITGVDGVTEYELTANTARLDIQTRKI
jgi:outer membrane receptor protein involved in Fe transport